MIINEILSEANLLVPNTVTMEDKLVWLNALNKDFFNIVKIPRVMPFTPILGQSNYIMSNDVRLKNIDLVMCGIIKYKELVPETSNPLQNTYTYDDSTYTLTLRPAPYQAGLQALTRYSRISTTTFIQSVLDVAPDAPEEYHWTFIPGLAAYLAAAMDDDAKASIYEAQYKAAWNKAAQNYTGSVAT